LVALNAGDGYLPFAVSHDVRAVLWGARIAPSFE
jgi:hypothetical protein